MPCILLAFLFILLYSGLPGPDLEGFSTSIRTKLAAYAFLYLHMPLAMAITLCSISLGHVKCMAQPDTAPAPHSASTSAIDPTLLVLSTACGATLVLIGVLHLLSANRSRRHAAIRIASGTLVCAVYPVFRTMRCRAALASIDCVLFTQVILDYSSLLSQDTRPSTGSIDGD